MIKTLTNFQMVVLSSLSNVLMSVSMLDMMLIRQQQLNRESIQFAHCSELPHLLQLLVKVPRKEVEVKVVPQLDSSRI